MKCPSCNKNIPDAPHCLYCNCPTGFVAGNTTDVNAASSGTTPTQDYRTGAPQKEKKTLWDTWKYGLIGGLIGWGIFHLFFGIEKPSMKSNNVPSGKPAQQTQAPAQTATNKFANLKSYPMTGSITKQGIKVTFTELQINGADVGLHFTVENRTASDLLICESYLIVDRTAYEAKDNGGLYVLETYGFPIQSGTSKAIFVTVGRCPLKSDSEVILRTKFKDSYNGPAFRVDFPVKLPAF